MVALGIPVEICPTSNMQTVQSGVINMLSHLNEFNKLKHNVVICCDDTSKRHPYYNEIVLFGTNISNEMFEYAKAVGGDIKQIKELLLRNVDSIFDEESKVWVKSQIIKFHC